jgi:hypothetical protein
MRTKLPWYLNSFYPLFAVAISVIICHGLTATAVTSDARRRRVAIAGFAVLVFAVAEGKLLWYSFNFRDVGLSAQAVLIAERGRLQGARVYLREWNIADAFVARAIAGAEPLVAADAREFVRAGRSNGYLVSDSDGGDPNLVVVRTVRGRRLYGWR